MGFFSDLKEDLSQAVTELLPEDESKFTEESLETKEMQDDLSNLLDKLESENDMETLEAEPSLDVLDLDSLDLDMPKAAIEEPKPAPVKPIPEPVPATFPMPTSTYERETYKAPEVAAPISEPAPVREVAPSPVPTPAPAPAAPVFIPNKVASNEVSTIMESMIINGNMATEGSLEIRGAVVGNVEALGKLNIEGSIQGNSSAAEIFAENAKITGDVRSAGTIKIGQATTIIGNVYATSAVIAGAVKGDIDVKGPVILDSTAIVLGNIKSKSVQINNGAVIEGMCSQCYAEVNPISFFEELKKMK